MTDILVVGLLLTIILMLIMFCAPELAFYAMFVFCIIGLVICIVVLGAQFIHDPIGFLYDLVFVNNPMVVFEQNLIDNMPIFNQTVVP